MIWNKKNITLLQLLFVFFLIPGTAAFGYTLKEATHIAAANLLQVVKDHAAFRNIHFQIKDKSPSISTPIISEIESSLFMAFQKKTLGPILERSSLKDSDILIEGTYVKKRERVYLELNAEFKGRDGGHSSATNISFKYHITPSRSLTALVGFDTPFEDEAFNTALNLELNKKFLETGHFKLIPQYQLNGFNLKMLKQQTGCTEGGCAIQMGKQFGLDQVMFTSIHSNGKKNYLLTAKIYSVSNGNLVMGLDLEHQGYAGSILFALETFTSQIIRKHLQVRAMLEMKRSFLGKFRVTSSPTKAKIFIDGKLLLQKTDAVLFDIPVGRHVLKVRKGNISKSRTIYVEAGVNKHQHFSLTPPKIKPLPH